MSELVVQSKSPNIIWVSPKLIDKKISSQYYLVNYIQYENVLRKNKTKPLKDIISEYNGGPMGFQLHSYDYVTEGIPILRTRDMAELTIKLSEPIFISQQKQNELKNSRTYPEDILISKTGQIGVVAIVPKSIKEANLNQALCNIRVKENIIDKYFLTIFLSSKYGQYQLIRQGEGKAVQDGLTKDEILELQIPILSTEIQKYIGDKVRKSEKLREEAKRLKEEAENLLYSVIGLRPLNEMTEFKYTFVKESYIDSDRLDSTYYSTNYIRLEEILKKVNAVKLMDILAKCRYGASVPSNYTSKGIPFIRGTNLIENEIDIDNIVYLDNSLKNDIGECTVDTEDVLITRSGTVGITAVVNKECKGFSYGSFMIKFCVKNKIWDPYYIAAFLNSFWGKWQIKRLQNGAVQQNINIQELGRILIPKVSMYDQKKVRDAIKSYINKKVDSKRLIKEAKQDVEDIIEGNFDISKVKKGL